MRFDLDDTIAAISTPVGEGGIGIVRLSGKEALRIADEVFSPKDGKRPSEFKTYTTHYGWIVDSNQKPVTSNQKMNSYQLPITNYQIVDEAILTVMRAPKSYTREDVVEINCHAGIVPLRRILDLVLQKGARLAQPGEFTKRAFLNGRIDLSQAEAVLDIIRAKTESALKIGLEQLKGSLSGQINKARNLLLDALSILEANIDFPEEDIGAIDLETITRKLDTVNNELKGILESARQGQVLREGINVVICGKPNVGKSSLLNTLLKKERSIVTAIPGTTRDTIEEIIDIRGIPIMIVDTAGTLKPNDLIEKKAVQRSNRYIDLADLVILLLDASRKLSQEDEMLIKKLKRRTVLVAINKIDLKQKIEKEKILKIFKWTVEISAKKNKNINLLEDKIEDLVYNGKVNSKESIIVSNLRHIVSLRKIQQFIATSLNSLNNRLSPEFIAQDIKEALLYSDELLGKRFSEDLLDKIFSEFCIGK